MVDASQIINIMSHSPILIRQRKKYIMRKIDLMDEDTIIDILYICKTKNGMDPVRQSLSNKGLFIDLDKCSDDSIEEMYQKIFNKTKDLIIT